MFQLMAIQEACHIIYYASLSPAEAKVMEEVAHKVGNSKEN
jgi:hypothetical protein